MRTGWRAGAAVVVVHATGEVTLDGNPVYADVAGTPRVAVRDGVARLLGPASRTGRHTCRNAVLLP
ncbi:DUF6296 family protein [Kitasatospora sp. NPDC051705]|uniref:DUF6296 family protein n=1 Tax=Kitasatospora sp. NPDC051705 TaxID=3364057 RepID=UPI0037A21589